MLHRLFTAPDHLYRTSQLLGNDDRLTDIIVFPSPAETASQKAIVEIDVLHGNARQLGCFRDGPFRILCSDPQVHAIRRNVSGAVHRLHHGMIQIRDFVHGLHDLRGVPQRCLGVPLLRHHSSARFIQQLSRHFEEALAAVAAVCTLIPLDGKRVQSGPGAPITVGYDGHSFLDAGPTKANDGMNTRTMADGIRVKVLQLSLKHG